MGLLGSTRPVECRLSLAAAPPQPMSPSSVDEARLPVPRTTTRWSFALLSVSLYAIAACGDSTGPDLSASPYLFQAVSAGGHHTCGLRADSTLLCWGWNGYGQVGDGTASDRWAPTPVAGSRHFTMIDAGWNHTCAVGTDGAAYCWGGNVYGEVGDGTYSMDEGPRREPTAVIGGHTFTSLTAGGGPCHGKSCGITPDGATLCWGRSYQSLSGAFEDRYPTSPTAIEGDPGFVTVDPGPLSVCGISADGSLYCWGTGRHGAVGTGTPDDVRLPTPIMPDSSFISVSVGAHHACAVTAGGATLCWGTNSDGQLGNGSSPEGWLFPVPVWKP